MSEKSYRGAIRETIYTEMARDPDIIIIGEDIAGGAGGSGEDDAWGGAMGVTKGLLPKFGADRVLDTPISEAAFIGAAIGAAAAGLRPIAELMFNDFIGVCCDQIINQAAKYRYTFGGQDQIPLTIRTTLGAGLRIGSQHSQSLHSIFTQIPGLKVAMPSSAYDAKGLLISAIRDDDPVIFCEHKLLYSKREDVPDESYLIPFGEANFLREGRDVTIVGFSRMALVAVEAATLLQEYGIECEVIDPRTTSPLDLDSIIESVELSGRLVVVDEAPPRCGIAADIIAQVVEHAFAALKAPIVSVTSPHIPIPAAPNLEDAYIPNAARVVNAVRRVMEFGK